MKLLIASLMCLLIGLACSSCASHPLPVPVKPHYSGICRHPSVNNGKPFEVANDVIFDGNMMHVFFESGEMVSIYGAQCVLKMEQP